MKINSDFDGGNIEVVSLQHPDDIQLKISKDKDAAFLQWFYFNFVGTKDQEYKIKIINAHETTHSADWPQYKIVASYDNKKWFRVPTQYDGKNLIIQHRLAHHSIYFAYFVPYSYERLQNLITSAQLIPHCQIEKLCQTIDGNPINLFILGRSDANKRKCWIIARQHPGETMGSWFCEGLIHRLLDIHDNLTTFLLSKMTFYIVPNMNPDGCIRGNLRANAAGINLNRQWQSPDKHKAPEVYFVHKKMQETGVDFFLDAHGDEEIPYVFMLSNNQLPGYDHRLQQLEKTFRQAYQLANPDFQNDYGYPLDAYSNEELLTLASGAIGTNYKCLAFTLEMPFLDNANFPDEKYGWSPERSMQLGAALLMSLRAVVEQL